MDSSHDQRGCSTPLETPNFVPQQAAGNMRFNARELPGNFDFVVRQRCLEHLVRMWTRCRLTSCTAFFIRARSAWSDCAGRFLWRPYSGSFRRDRRPPLRWRSFFRAGRLLALRETFRAPPSDRTRLSTVDEFASSAHLQLFSWVRLKRISAETAWLRRYSRTSAMSTVIELMSELFKEHVILMAPDGLSISETRHQIVQFFLQPVK
jgi:hypothetical protein